MHKPFVVSLMLGISVAASAVCSEPQPRMVCAEYFQSQAVVVAKLIQTTHHVPKDERDSYTCELRLEKAIRVTVPPTFKI